MATPFGHGFVGMALARRMGVRSPLGLAAAFFAANLPDVDIPIGGIIGKDIHRGPRTRRTSPSRPGCWPAWRASSLPRASRVSATSCSTA